MGSNLPPIQRCNVWPYTVYYSKTLNSAHSTYSMWIIWDSNTCLQHIFTFLWANMQGTYFNAIIYSITAYLCYILKHMLCVYRVRGYCIYPHVDRSQLCLHDAEYLLFLYFFLTFMCLAQLQSSLIHVLLINSQIYERNFGGLSDWFFSIVLCYQGCLYHFCPLSSNSTETLQLFCGG